MSPSTVLGSCDPQTKECPRFKTSSLEFLKPWIKLHRNAIQVGQEFEVGQNDGKGDSRLA